MRSSTDQTCELAREWLSAARDGEAVHNPAAAAHIDGCARCTLWASALDIVTRSTRLRAPAAPSHLRAMRPALGAAPQMRSRRLLTVARALLVLTVIAGLAGVVLGIAGADGHGDLSSVDSRDAWAMNLALLVGFALTAWRPDRNAAGLLPIASIAAIVTIVMSVLAWPSNDNGVLDELLHLPIVIGALGSVIAFVASMRSTTSVRTDDALPRPPTAARRPLPPVSPPSR